jgi:hypothetical protein
VPPGNFHSIRDTTGGDGAHHTSETLPHDAALAKCYTVKSMLFGPNRTDRTPGVVALIIATFQNPPTESLSA